MRIKRKNKNKNKNKYNLYLKMIVIMASFLFLILSIEIKNGILTLHYPSFVTNYIEKSNIAKILEDKPSDINNESSVGRNNDLNITADDTSQDLVVDIDTEVNKTDDFFELKYNCNKGGFNYFSYYTVPDPHIDESRYSPFHYDPQVGEKCNYSKEQINKADNTSTYKDSTAEYKYDRGHGNHQNIWDHDKKLMKITNYMYNIVPQESTQNRRGLWRHSEVITQCFRQDNELHVIGGNIWGNDTSNDHFVESHGVVTPDYLFKVIVINNKEVLAFIIPNNPEATPDESSKYMTSVHDIEDKVGYKINIDESLKDIVAEYIPKKPSKCSIK